MSYSNNIAIRHYRSILQRSNPHRSVPVSNATQTAIVDLLRRQPRTIAELATALNLTPGAVRAHLANLEGEHIVERRIARRPTVGKPPTMYSITADAEELFSRTYPAAFAALIDLLSRKLRAEELESLMRTLGQRLAAGRIVAGHTVRERVEGALELLRELGTPAAVEWGELIHTIRAFGCPLNTASIRHPEVCATLASLLASTTGLEVRDHCHRGDRARCRFELGEVGRVADASGDPG
ncbi:MAG TPA: ArsR family transcriptional regulator [Gemmatimonadaceae bacterium]|nr:ArsR family transcriptional regulator [Gemmatimonadaceae bacterium]